MRSVLGNLFFLLIAGGIVWAEKPKDLDVVVLKSGATLQGCLVTGEAPYIKMENIGGSIVVPFDSVEKIVRARPGESALMLGMQLMDRRKFERAVLYIDKAKGLPQWKAECDLYLKQIEIEKNKLEEARRLREEVEIQQIIERRGLEAGIEALQRRSREDDRDYWGNVRGRIHLLMAMDRLDHLDFKAAERHLALAERYGADPKEWNNVRQKLVAMKRSNLLGGRDYLAQRKDRSSRAKATTSDGKLFLARVMKAKELGDKLPPLDLLQLVERYAGENDLDPLLVWALIDTESSWRINVVSNKGAQGLMQLMPGTAKEMEVSDPFNPEENIRGGTQYLRFLVQMFHDMDVALAAYYVGPGRMEKANGIPKDGTVYIQKVRKRYDLLRERYG